MKFDKLQASQTLNKFHKTPDIQKANFYAILKQTKMVLSRK